jgi:FkbM family methyltransferase
LLPQPPPPPPRRIEAGERAASVIAEFDSRRRSGRYDRLPAHHQPFEEPYVVRHEVAGMRCDVLIANENAVHWYEDPERAIATAVYCGEFDVVRSLELARQGDVVLDCGAHHGVLSAMLAKVVGPAGHVYAFEPSLIGSDLVELNAALNGLQNVTAVRAAVGDETGSGRFSERDARFGINDFDGAEVPRIVLDDYADARPRLLKIDVEGAEGAALAGAKRLLGSVPNLMLEVHPERMVQSEGTTQEAIIDQVDWSHYQCFQAIGAPPYSEVERPRLPKEGGWVAARRRTGMTAALRRAYPARRQPATVLPTPVKAQVLAEAGGIYYDLTQVADDPLAKTILNGDVPGGFVHDAVLRCAGPGTRLLDLGARIGTTALHAAAAGAKVVAVEADPAYVASLLASGGLSGFELEVVPAIAAAEAGNLQYSPAGPWGHVRKVTEIDDVTTSLVVASVSGDELLARVGWNGADVIKLTLSGYEPFALGGLERTLRGSGSPALLAVESNAHALSWYDRTPQDLREQIAALGYLTFLVDRVRPERIVPVGPQDIQPDCVSTLLGARDAEVVRRMGYEIAPYSEAEITERLIAACASEGATDRWHALREFERGPQRLREEPVVEVAVERLQRDPTGIVRDAAWWANEAQPGADPAQAVVSGHDTTAMEVPGAGTVTFALPDGPADPVARELAARHEYPPFAPNQLFLALLRPGMAVLDLGANIGTFSLPAAALGARVVAVDAHPQHARLLERSVELNDLADRLTVVHAAIAEERGEVELICMFGWSSVAPSRQYVPPGAPRRISVRAMPTFDVLTETGLSRVDLIKMDLEGSERRALKGMAGLLEGADAPPVLFEVCSEKLNLLGSSESDLLAAFAQLGYRLYKLEQPEDERLLVPIGPDVFLPEPADDVLAIKHQPRLDGWRVREPLTRHDQVDRTLQVARSPWRSARQSIARKLREAPAWLLRDPLIREALRALRHDGHPPVRAEADWSKELD